MPRISRRSSLTRERTPWATRRNRPQRTSSTRSRSGPRSYAAPASRRNDHQIEPALASVGLHVRTRVRRKGGYGGKPWVSFRSWAARPELEASAALNALTRGEHHVGHPGKRRTSLSCDRELGTAATGLEFQGRGRR